MQISAMVRRLALPSSSSLGIPGFTVLSLFTLLCMGAPLRAQAAGTLTPTGSAELPIQILEHRVAVVIQNGFARTEVTQTFHNPNPYDLEAIYAFPVPKSASLSEVTLQMGERSIDGEVVARKQAEQIYVAERDRGNDAGLAVKNGHQTFEFAVTPVAANARAQMRFVYYQPLEIDTGIARYLYGLEDGGTDRAAASFWTRNEQVQGTFSMDVEIESAWPIDDVRVAGFESAASVQRESEGHYRVSLSQPSATLNRDLVLYYRLQDGLPGRVEVIPYRADASGPGTFMAVITPGIDLAPLESGADYVFVLDTSGSMAGKLGTLSAGVVRTIDQLDSRDRFRIITFADSARDLTNGFVPVTPQTVAGAAARVQALSAGGSTNLYEAVSLALSDLDADRATSVVLVTDAETNTGVIEPSVFRQLLQQHDIRVFGFLMGNGANWPLMRTIAEASGGFYAGVSNSDDIIGQILLAKSKLTHEALHAAKLSLRGVPTSDVTGLELRKIFRGQQLVLFGRYAKAGPATLELRASLTGKDRTYTTSFEFPEVDTENPEIERLWALARIEQLDAMSNAGLAAPDESSSAIRDLGIQYQLVTDETSMLVLSDEGFVRHGIERRNRARVATERTAQTRRASQPVQNRRVDTARPTYSRPAPSLGGGGGGGALDPIAGLCVIALAATALIARMPRTAARRGPLPQHSAQQDSVPQDSVPQGSAQRGVPRQVRS